MTVQDAEAPGRHHEQPGAREQNANERHRHVALFALESAGDQRQQLRREQNAKQHEDGNDQRENREDSAGESACFLTLVALEQIDVDRNERRGQRAFAEEVL